MSKITPAKPGSTVRVEATRSTPAPQAPTETAAQSWTARPQTRPVQPAATAPAKPLGVPADPKQMDIVCPVLGALVGSGKLKMAEDGTVKFSDLSKSLEDNLGLTMDLRAAALAAATIANPSTLHNLTSQEFNVLELRSGRLKHQADSMILTNGKFDEQKFQALASHAENGFMTADSFAKAVIADYDRDAPLGEEASKDGVGISKVEFGLALTAFGTPGPDGKIGIKVEDLRMLYQDKKIPTHLVNKGSVSELISMSKLIGKGVDAQFAARALNGPSTAGGLSQAGVRLAKGESDSAATPATLSAGKAANCPHLNGAAKQKTQSPSEVIASHLE